MTNSTSMVKLEITVWTGHGWPVAVVADPTERSDEPQSGRKRPVLRLIKGGVS